MVCKHVRVVCVCACACAHVCECSYVRTYVRMRIHLQYAHSTMLHLLKYWSPLVSCSRPTPSVIIAQSWLNSKHGRGWLAGWISIRGRKQNTTTNTLQQYTTDGGRQVPYGALVKGSPAGWSPSWGRHGVHCPPLWQSPSLSAVTRGSERKWTNYPN